MQAPGIHPALRKFIGSGPNAGQPRPMNEIYLDRLTSVIAAVVVLKKNGFSVSDINLNTALPTITIDHVAKCEELIAAGLAHDNGGGVSDGVHWREMASKLNGCLVVWREKAH